MTIYCRAHIQFEGVDLGKVHDHIETDHVEELSGIGSLKEYAERYRRIFAEDLFEIAGPNRLSDSAWIKQTWGRPPKLGTELASTDTERKR